MMVRKLAEFKRLGGGLVLLPGDMEPFSTDSVVLYKVLSLADRAFYVEPGLVFDAMTALNLLRMNDISQLQVLTMAEIGDGLRALKLPHRFPHKRLPHNLRAGALHGLMAERCELNAAEIAVGVLADCMHDNFTCAGGDSWKDINHQKTLFDEDDHFADKIFRYYNAGWRSLCHQYGLNPEKTAKEMQDIIDGRGLRGQIHEIADTASYMLGDLAEIERASMRSEVANSDAGRKFREIIRASQEEWDIWNHVAVEDYKLVVTNPWALENFLRLRMMLWEKLYQNPATKFLELLARDIMYPYLVNHKRINLAELPLRGDAWLHDLVERKMGLAAGALMRLDLLGEFPRRMSFPTWVQALDEEDRRHASGAFTLMFSTKDFQASKSKTDKYFVKGPEGKAISFKEARPTEAKLIDEIARLSVAPHKSVNVCWVENPVIPDNLRPAWEEARARWRERK